MGRELHFVKLPNFLSVEPRPFDKDTYEDEIDEEETLDEEGRARSVSINLLSLQFYLSTICFNNPTIMSAMLIFCCVYRLKLKVENTIRWREVFDKDGNVIKESNARFIRWSDGSLSLHLGSEIFDVYKQPLQVCLSEYIILFYVIFLASLVCGYFVEKILFVNKKQICKN